jgi:hypothetical protein
MLAPCHKRHHPMTVRRRQSGEWRCVMGGYR